MTAAQSVRARTAGMTRLLMVKVEVR